MHKREIAFYETMKEKGIELNYQPKRFYLSNGSYYIPDFHDPKENKYYEFVGTKERWYTSKEKIKLFQKEYTEINFEIVFNFEPKESVKNSTILIVYPEIKGKDYLLRYIPNNLWRKFQSLLALEGRSKKEFFLTKITEYINQERG